MKQKQNNQATTVEKPAPQTSSNKILFWILGGCLVLFVITGLIVGGLMYWGYRKVQKDIKENQPRLQELNAEMEKMRNEAGQSGNRMNSSAEEPPAISEEGAASGDSSSLYPPAVTEKAMGYIKKVYTQGGKNYLNIDYIQWLTGTEAQKAMREDGECPKTGECIVYDDYYIRNVNPLIRTYELTPDVEIVLVTYNLEQTGEIQDQKVTFSQFKQIWSDNDPDLAHLKNMPYHIEIGNQKILKIKEQYIP